MLNHIRVDNLKKLVESQVNSKAISVYFNLCLLSVKGPSEYMIYDHNPHKIMRLMNARGINISHQQVINSIKELEEAKLVGYANQYSHKWHTFKVHKNKLVLLDSFTSNDKVVTSKEDDFTEITEIHENFAYIYLSRDLTESDFYDLNVRAKRMTIWLLTHFAYKPSELGKKRIQINITKAKNVHYFRMYMHLNSESKIRHTFEEISDYIGSHLLTSMKSRNRTFQFYINKDFVNSFDKELISTEEIFNFDNKIRKHIELLYKKHDKSLDPSIIKQLILVMLSLSRRNLTEILEAFLKFNTTGIKTSYNAYFTSIYMRYFSDWNRKELFA